MACLADTIFYFFGTGDGEIENLNFFENGMIVEVSNRQKWIFKNKKLTVFYIWFSVVGGKIYKRITHIQGAIHLIILQHITYMPLGYHNKLKNVTETLPT